MNPYALGAVAGGAVLLFAGGAKAFAPASGMDQPFSIEYGGAGEAVDPSIGGEVFSGGPQDFTDSNLASFLYLIRLGESSNNYLAVGGNRQASCSYDHHPGWTDRSMTKKSAWGADGSASHPAGAYQYQPGTFKEATDALGLDGSFSQDNQDAAAVWCLQRRDAFELVAAGQVAEAVDNLKPEWEFFTQWSLAKVVDTFENNGGTLA